MKLMTLFLTWVLSLSLVQAKADVASREHASRSDRIAVIGAGASGLTAAYYLKRLGYEQITVYERNARVGGKVHTFSDGDHRFELGALWIGENYPTILEIARHHGIEVVRDDVDVLATDGTSIYRFQDGLLARLHPLTMPLAALRLKHVYWKFYGDIAKVGFDQVDPDLYMSFETFARKYGIEPFAAAFRPFWIGCGYGYYEETPALYVLKMMLPALASSLRDVIGSLSFDAWSRGLYYIPAGYQTLLEAVAAELGDVRLSAEVTRVERHVIDGRVRIRVDTGDSFEEFDRVVISTDPKATLRFLDATVEERRLFSQVVAYPYTIHVLRADIAYPSNSMVFFDQFTTRETAGHVVALFNRAAAAGVWTAARIGVPLTGPTGTLPSDLAADLEEMGARKVEVLAQAQWDYFPHVGSKALEEGFYEDLEALQGVNGTYYVGGVMNFEMVENTARYAKELIVKHF